MKIRYVCEHCSQTPLESNPTHYTGCVRRVDDLGRITIPGEIRKRMPIVAGDSLEISTSVDSIVLRKYQPVEGEDD